MQNRVTKYLRQHTKNRVILMIFSMYLTYPLIKYVSSLMNEVDGTAPEEPIIDMLLKKI